MEGLGLAPEADLWLKQKRIFLFSDWLTQTALRHGAGQDTRFHEVKPSPRRLDEQTVAWFGCDMGCPSTLVCGKPTLKLDVLRTWRLQGPTLRNSRAGQQRYLHGSGERKLKGQRFVTRTDGECQKQNQRLKYSHCASGA
jgi:hypothetical protein